MEITWKALSDPVRRDIVALLRENPRTTGELCASFGHLTRFGVMNHIAVLKDARLIRVEKKGRQRINSLDPGPLRELYEDWLREYEVLWAGRLGRLKRLAETMEKDKKMQEVSGSDLPLAGLLIRQSVEIDATPEVVFAALTEGVGNWWGAPYLLSGEDATDMTVEPWLGGLFKESTGDGEGFIWCTVEQLVRNRLLTLNGRMAMREAVAGQVRFELEPSGSGTLLNLEHRAIGHITGDTEQQFGEGWKDLLGVRLKSYAERGEICGIRGAGSAS